MSGSHSAPPVQTGDVLDGKFRVERVLGVGGMGVVVAATHLDLNELRAVKYMLPAARESAELVARFLREARACVKLKSEHAVRVFDVGRFQSGEPYMVMEHLHGADLDSMAEASGALDPAVVVDYMLQALDAIAEAHRLGIIHRDLKPANLFLSQDEHGVQTVKVLDFGISKITGDAGRGEDFDMTKTATMLGSPYYMSPEQMRSTKDVDLRTDIWSIGVILYQLLTGERPFVGDSITSLCGSVFTQQPQSLRARRSDLPPGLDAAVMGCLEKDPAKRHGSAAELAAALAPFGGPNANARLQRVMRHSDPRDSGRHAVPEHTAPEATRLPETGSAGFPGPGTSASFAQSAPAEISPSSGQSSSSRRPAVVAFGAVMVLGVIVGGLVLVLNRSTIPDAAPTSHATTGESPTSTATSIATSTATQTPTVEPTATATATATTSATASASASASASVSAPRPKPRPFPAVPRPRSKDPFGTGRE